MIHNTVVLYFRFSARTFLIVVALSFLSLNRLNLEINLATSQHLSLLVDEHDTSSIYSSHTMFLEVILFLRATRGLCCLGAWGGEFKQVGFGVSGL